MRLYTTFYGNLEYFNLLFKIWLKLKGYTLILNGEHIPFDYL